MTGYGTASVKTSFGTVTVELKAVNQRFQECHIRLPHYLLKCEEAIRKQVKKQILRGKVDLFVAVEDDASSLKKLTVDTALLDQYIEAANLIADRLPHSEPARLDAQSLLLQTEIATVTLDTGEQAEEMENAILEAVALALASLNEMRLQEGEHLFQDITESLWQLAGLCDLVERQAAKMVGDYQEKIKTRLQEYLKEVELDQDRLLTEVGLLADKADIREEIVRLRSHLSQFDHYCQLDEAVGRRLDFLVQEMNREVNTIGSKALDTQIRQHVVEMKGFIEKIKEQVQNIE
ncbi:YicC family protein [Alkalihalobacillus oceani]|uniref:YicC/YloC family endoribonuclease n=1 Tax=Halalkalibacter oceani TaxID=1653776 RepID=UPI00203D362C|nr:YicC/YloC family endoribonuclease [Halalkalibacter oceani]MCM3759392.1 YicC family protein [Halalkalibacter oceani]